MDAAAIARRHMAGGIERGHGDHAGRTGGPGRREARYVERRRRRADRRGRDAGRGSHQDLLLPQRRRDEMGHRSHGQRSHSRARGRIEGHEPAGGGIHAPDDTSADDRRPACGAGLPARRQRAVGSDLDFAERAAARHVYGVAVQGGSAEAGAHRGRRNLAADASEGTLAQHVPGSALAGDEDPAARDEHGAQRPEVLVAGVVACPGRGGEEAFELERGRELDHRIAAVVGAGGGAIADRDVEVARRVDHRPARCPDGSFADDRDPVRDRDTCTARGNAYNLTYVLAAIAGQPAESYVHVAVGDREGRTLLVSPRIVAGQIHGPRPADRSGGRIEGEEDVMEAGDFGHDEQRTGHRVVRGRARNAEWIDVAAWQGRQRHRSADIAAPQDRPGGRVDGVDAVAFGGRDDGPVHDERLGIDGPVQRGRPAGGERSGKRREGGVIARALGVHVIDRPIGRGRDVAADTRRAGGPVCLCRPGGLHRTHRAWPRDQRRRDQDHGGQFAERCAEGVSMTAHGRSVQMGTVPFLARPRIGHGLPAHFPGEAWCVSRLRPS